MKILIEINADIIFIPPVLSFLEEFCKINRFKEEEIKKIAIATEESLTNIIKHSYHNIKEKRIHVELEFKNKYLTILLKHRGDEFELDENCVKVDIDKILRERKKGGFGLYIIKKFTDEFKIGKDKGWSFYLLKKKLKQ